MNTIQSKWEEYLRDVVPDAASEVQIEETQKAFYAGAFSALSIMTQGVRGISQEAGVAILEGLFEEHHEFAESLKAKGYKII